MSTIVVEELGARMLFAVVAEIDKKKDPAWCSTGS